MPISWSKLWKYIIRCSRFFKVVTWKNGHNYLENSPLNTRTKLNKLSNFPHRWKKPTCKNNTVNCKIKLNSHVTNYTKSVFFFVFYSQRNICGCWRFFTRLNRSLMTVIGKYICAKSPAILMFIIMLKTYKRCLESDKISFYFLKV